MRKKFHRATFQIASPQAVYKEKCASMNVIQTLRESMSPLQHPNFRLYLGGQAVSLIGTWLQSTAQAWVVYDLTNKSEAALSIVNVLNALPVLFLSTYAGVWADRIDRRKLLIGTQVVAMLLAFILAFLKQTELIQVWHVYILALILGVVTALDMPAQQAFLGDLTGRAEIRKAINLNIMILQISRILGPAMAGLIVARLGVAPAFWLNGVSFIAVIASLVLVRAAQAQPKVDQTARPLRQIADGIAYVRTQPRMQDLFIFGTLLTFFVFSIIMNVLPAVADKMLGGNAETLGQLMSASGVGALISVLFIVPLTQALRRSGLVMLLACFWLAFWLTVFAQSRSLPLSLVALCFGSMGAPAVMTMAMGLVQTMSPADMRGRMASLFGTISFGFQPVAAVWIGQIAERYGVANAIQLNAILLTIFTGMLLFFRRAILTAEYVGKVKKSPEVMPEALADVERAPGR
jgi:MFS family permease